MIKVSDYIANFIASTGVRHVFSLAGGQIMHIMDSVNQHEKLKYVPALHEQAVAMMAEAYSRATNNFGVCLLTTGPGGTNAMTGLASAWYDSTPCMFISGQFRVELLPNGKKIRQTTLQQTLPIDFVKPLTKYSALVADAHDIRFHLEKALFLSKSGRPGPVWLDIPLDVQGATIDEGELRSFTPDRDEVLTSLDLTSEIEHCLSLIKGAKRPVLFVGNGVRLAGAIEVFRRLAEKLGIPVLTSINGIDLIEDNHPLFMGRPNYWGQRHANFIIQNADLLLSIGSGLHLEITGYNHRAFARAAKKIIVDIDRAELEKDTVIPDLAIRADAGNFMRQLENAYTIDKSQFHEWMNYCKRLKQKYPIIIEAFQNPNQGLNPFVFTDALSDELDENEIVIPGNAGTHFTTCVQSFKVKKGQRVFSEIGIGAMGHSLPSSIAASIANDGKRVICITGDGGIQLNIQELQTVIANKLPIKIFIADNNGYMSLKNTQANYFDGRMTGCTVESGLILPDMEKIAQAYGFCTNVINNHEEMREKIRENLSHNGPFVSIVKYDPDAILQPRLSSKLLPNGNMISSPLEDLWPFLPKEEFEACMIVPSYI